MGREDGDREAGGLEHPVGEEPHQPGALAPDLTEPDLPENPFDRAIREGKRVVAIDPSFKAQVEEAVEAEGWPFVVIGNPNLPLTADGKHQAFIIDPSYLAKIEFNLDLSTGEAEIVYPKWDESDEVQPFKITDVTFN